MNNSNSRDVQDLIAEFVNASNPPQTEDSLSEEMHSDLIEGQKEESAPNNITGTSVDTGLFSVHNGMEVLQKQVEELKEKNLELRQQITEIQMQEAQLDATKPIGADDLRMEFLNFTSAHIQQFNTRIKKTEELIESQINKNQGTTDKRSYREYPVWLFWTNIAALILIAAYFIFQMFSSGNGNTPAIEKTETAAPANAPTAEVKPSETAVLIRENSPNPEKAASVAQTQESNANGNEQPKTALTSLNQSASASQATSSPFRSNTINTTPPPPVPVAQKATSNTTPKIEPVQKPVYPKTQSPPVSKQTSERQALSNPLPAGSAGKGNISTASANRTPVSGSNSQSSNTASRSKLPETSKTETKKPAQTNIIQTQSERKPSKEKVFFGED